MKYRKSMLCGGLVLCGTLGALGAFGGHFTEKEKIQLAGYQRQVKTVSGEIVHIDEDTYATWGFRAGSSGEFENLRVKEGDKIYKLIHLGPSSYKVGDKVKGLEYKCLEEGISIRDLNDLLTSAYTACQTGYVEADGIIIRHVPRHIKNLL